MRPRIFHITEGLLSKGVAARNTRASDGPSDATSNTRARIPQKASAGLRVGSAIARASRIDNAGRACESKRILRLPVRVRSTTRASSAQPTSLHVRNTRECHINIGGHNCT